LSPNAKPVVARKPWPHISSFEVSIVRSKDGVFAHRVLLVARSRKCINFVTGQFQEIPEYCEYCRGSGMIVALRAKPLFPSLPSQIAGIALDRYRALYLRRPTARDVTKPGARKVGHWSVMDLRPRAHLLKAPFD